MNKVIIYSIILLIGIACSQNFDLSPYQGPIHIVSSICLAYIMIEVGLVFTINKHKLNSYVKDYLVAATAASFPWILCFFYFFYSFDISLSESLLVSRFTAPTSAGLLFTMLAAAGLAKTWLFQKARNLAIFDDLDTILFMIPLQILFLGFSSTFLIALLIMLGLLFLGYKFLNQINLPTENTFVFIYSLLTMLILIWLEIFFHITIEILLPAFVVGCLLKHETFKMPERFRDLHPITTFFNYLLDISIKRVFMFLVGCSLPQLSSGTLTLSSTIYHVFMVTILSNLGKCFPIFCYKDEANLKTRLALSISMFPRGEVGAGILLLSISYGISETATTIAGLSLVLNLLLTGVFIMVVLKLINKEKEEKHNF